MSTLTYIWQMASDCPEELIVIHDERTVDPMSLRAANPVPNAASALFFHDGLKSDFVREAYIPNSALLPLVSVSAAREIGKLPGVYAQQLPARVRCSDGEIPCVLLNPLKTVSAVDWAATKAVFISGTKHVRKFHSLQLLPNPLGGNSIARLGEFSQFVLVTEAVKNVLTSSSLCEFDLPANIKP